jgi:predicted transposase/invertase (TIGR01784 family)
MGKVKKIGVGVQDAESEAREPKVFAKLIYDSGFKIVFGTEGRSEKLLMTMLNRLLGLKIVKVKYLPTERLGLTEEESKSVFDIYCRDSHGRRFLIEMQMWSQHYYHKRAVYYSTLSVQDQCRIERQIQKGQGRPWDYYFAPVFQVSFLNFPNLIVGDKDDGCNQYVSHFVYRSKDTGRELGDGTNIIFIDLQKFMKSEDECETLQDKWLYSIRNMHMLKERPAWVAGSELEELYNEAEIASWSSEKRIQYEKNIMNQNDYDNIFYERYHDGHKIGRAEGRAEGHAEGRAEGHAEGRSVGVIDGKSEVAKNMLKEGMDVDLISRLTGLTEEQIRRL